MSCSKHAQKAYEMVCSSCHNKLVCHECIEKIHTGHKFEELKTAAERITVGLQKQKMENLHFSEIKGDLKDLQTIRTREQELADQTREETLRRRDLLKRVIDEFAEKLLFDQEKYFQKIFTTLDEYQKENQEKVLQILQFQSKLAELMKEDNYIKVIKEGKSMALPRYTKHPMLSMKRMTLKPGCPIDREQLQKAFGPIDIDDMMNSYIIHPIQVSSVYSEIDSVTSDELYGDGRQSQMTNPTREHSLAISELDNDVGRREVSQQSLEIKLNAALTNKETLNMLDNRATFV